MPGPGIEPEPFGWEAEALPLSYIPLLAAETSSIILTSLWARIKRALRLALRGYSCASRTRFARCARASEASFARDSL